MSDGNGALPEGWAEVRVSELPAQTPNALTIGPFGSNLKVADYTESGVPLVFVREIRNECFDDGKTKFVTAEKAESLRSHQVSGDDLLMTKMGDPPGDTAIYPPSRPNAVITADCIKLTPNPDVSSSPFLKHWFRADEAKDKILEETKGVAQRKLSLKRFRTIELPLPPLAEQRRIVLKIESLQERSSRARRALSEVGPLLEQFRQSVLRAAFSGRLTADWRAAHRLPAPKGGRWWVYAVECEDDSIYIGMTDDLPNRWKQHREGKGAQWTKTHKPRYVIHWEELDSREAAAKREKELKSGYGRKWLKREREAGRLRQAGDVEPATELLSRIRTERRHRWEQSELAKYKAKGKQPPKNWQDKYKEPQPLSEAELAKLTPLPDGWCWTTFETLTESFDHIRIPLKLADRDQRSGPYPYYGASGIIDDIDDFLFDGDFLLIGEDGANLLARSTPIAFLAHGKFWVNNHAHVSQTLAGVRLEYVEAFINGITLQPYVTGSAQPKLTQKNLNRIPVALAPIEEHEPMLEKIEASLETEKSMVAVLSESESALTQLDQSILAKAFRGELVPQDPRDEPASELLARIRTTREAAEETAKPKRRKKKTAQKQPLSPSPSATTVQQPLPLSVEETRHEPQDTPSRPSASHETPPAPIDETERNDAMASIRSVFIAHSDGLLREEAIRHLAHELGYKRTGSRIHEILGNDLIAAQKRRIIYREDDRYYLDCRSIEDYDRDDLVSLLQRAMGNTWWDETEAIKEATRLLGFRRTGRNITDAWKKTIALAIRRGELERSGTEIRRSK